ncbi:uncharacterized protein LOC143300703 isoform X1 [Babylonia areolata]|uniref:uncharacterized protein LOC143300703 isoform X1 n=1 Tax=Babylonia areolata TaxID=304850 RepID=UPI003FD4E896
MEDIEQTMASVKAPLSDINTSHSIPATTSPPYATDSDSVSRMPVASLYVTLSTEEKEWLVVSATADYHGMFRLLTRNGRLAKLRDISNVSILQSYIALDFEIE